MKLKKVLLSAATVVCASFALASCGGGNENADEVPDLTELNGTYDVKLWVSEVEGVTDLTAQQIDAFEELHPGITINATIEGVSEKDSATNMITSVETGADIYCFAQDQLNRLVTAGALSKIGPGTAEKLKEANDSSSVSASTVAGNMYCFPLTSDNGYFMFYDKSVVSQDHIDSLEDIIADCEKAQKMFSFECETSGWYNASWFFATGCHSNWGTDADGKFISVDDTFDSDAGIIALKGMQKLLKSSSYYSSSNGADFAAAVPSAVVVSGTWAASTIKEILGDNYGVADLPSFTVDGQSYHLGSFSGNKLMGFKPQADAKKASIMQNLCLYLTNEKCQLERFEKFAWGPSNKKAQASDIVKADETLSALAAQNNYAVPQNQIHGSWWDFAKIYATGAKNAELGDEKALKATLDDYKAACEGVFTMSDEVKNAWTVIGSMNNSEWSVDYKMTKQDDGTWLSDDTFTLAVDAEFKCRLGLAWDVSIGDGAGNFKVTEAGTYKVKLTVTQDGDSYTGTIELVPVA